MAKVRTPKEVTPAGIAAHAWLAKPDSGQKYSNDKFKITLVLPKSGDENQAQIDEFIAGIEERHNAVGGKQMNPCPVKDGDDKVVKDEDGNETPDDRFADHWMITFQSKFQPRCVGKGNVDLPEGVEVYGGDKVRVEFTVYPYDKGISLQLSAVKLLVKNNRGSGGGDSFDEDEGYGEDDGAAPSGDDSGDY